MGQNRTLHVLKMAVMLWGRKDEPGKARRKKKRKEVSGHIRGTKNNDDVGRTKSKKENLGLSKEVDQIKLNDILKHNIFQLKHGRKTEHFMK